MRVRQLMTTEVVTCRAAEDVPSAARTMIARGVGCVVALDDDGAIAGILTDRDVCRAVARAAAVEGMPVRLAMSAPVLTCRTDANVDEAAELMAARGFQRLVVVDGDGRLAGFLSIHDVAREAARQVTLVERGEKRAKDVRWADVGRALAAAMAHWSPPRAEATPYPPA